MQFKSLSYGHFPLNLLGMSAPETLGSRPDPHPPVPAGVRRSGSQGMGGGPDPPPTVTASAPGAAGTPAVAVPHRVEPCLS